MTMAERIFCPSKFCTANETWLRLNIFDVCVRKNASDYKKKTRRHQTHWPWFCFFAASHLLSVRNTFTNMYILIHRHTRAHNATCHRIVRDRLYLALISHRSTDMWTRNAHSVFIRIVQVCASPSVHVFRPRKQDSSPSLFFFSHSCADDAMCASHIRQKQPIFYE